MRSIAKELFIIALLLMIVVFMIGMIFYEYMPNNKTVPEPITYVADSSTTAVLQEILADSQTEESGSETESIIKSYSIGSKDLSTAAAKQSYTSGKTNPFAAYNETQGTSTNSNTKVSGSDSNNVSSSQAQQDSSSTGTFFENKNSK